MTETIEYLKNIILAKFTPDKDKSLKIANAIYLTRRLIKKNDHNKELKLELYQLLRELKM